jgi:F0F1-type ATP synthase assembly protein I
LAWIITKYLTTAFIVVLISEVAKRSDRLGGLIAALPLITVMALVWLYLEQQGYQKIANHAWYTFWYVIYKFTGFWPSLLICIAITGVSFVLLAFIVKPFGINLL